MTYQKYDSNDALCDFIKCIWVAQSKGGLTPVEETIRVLPDGCIDLVIQSGDLLVKQIQSDKEIKRSGSFFFGPAIKMVELLPLSGMAIVGVRFYPGAINSFFHEDFSYQINSISIQKCEGIYWDLLEKRIAAIESKKAKVKIVESFLLKYLNFSKHYGIVIKENVVFELSSKSSKHGIEFLAKHFKIGVRQLERKFLQSIGITPQVYMRIIRFQRLVRLYYTNGYKNLTELSYLSGYYDQSHFCKDVKWFTGLSPKKLFGGKKRMVNQ